MNHRALDALVVGVGARAANGLTALQVTMSVRANRMVVRETRFRDKHGEAIGMCWLGSLDPSLGGAERLAALAAPALRQAAFAWCELRGAAPLPVVLAVAERSRPGFDARVERSLLSTLEVRAETAIDHERSRVVPAGRAAGALALARAGELLDAGAPAVLLGGVDSYHDPDALEWLDAELRLHSMETENGFIPGEGAAFLMLTRSGERGSLPALARIASVGTGLEPHPYGAESPSTGEGATAAVRRAVDAAGLGAHGIEATVSDVQNERHRVDDWFYARTRAHGAISRDAPDEQPLLVTGDVGAASLPLMLAWCATSWGAGAWAPSSACLGVHSDGPERGAAIVARA